MAAELFPKSRDEMTAMWLGSVLGYDVTGIEIEPIGDDTGFAGSVFRIHIESSNVGHDLPKTVIWKRHSDHPPTHRMLKRLEAYSSETAFFKWYADSTPLAPRPYYAEYDPDSGSVCIIQEDLGRMRLGDQIAGCTVDESLDVMAALADLHATFWTESSTDRLRSLHTFDRGIRLFQLLHRRSWDRVAKSGAAPADLIEVALEITPHVGSIKSHLSQPPVTLLHGDARSDNLFFGSPSESGAVRFVDWQAARSGRSAYDIAYFLSTSLTVSARREMQDMLIRRYLDELSDRGIDCPTQTDFMADFRLALLDVVTLLGILTVSLDFGSTRGLELSNVWMSRLTAAIEDNNALGALDDLVSNSIE